MADTDVNIVGVNGGAVPEWATEKTLEAMLDKIESLVDVTKKQRTELKQAVKGSGKSGSGGDMSKEQKKAANMLGDLSKGLKDAAGSAVDTAAGFDKLHGPMGKFVKGLKKTNAGMYVLLAGVGMVANQATKAVVSIKEQVSTLRDLSDSGIRLEGSFMEMSRGLAEAGMTIAEFGELTSKYARVMNRQGFASLSNLASAVNEAEGGFKKWGLTQAEGTEITAELLDQQRIAGIFRLADQQRESATIADVMDKMTAYSKVLNVSRKEMLEGRKEMLADQQVRFRMSQMSAQERELMEKGLGNTAIALEALGDNTSWVAQAIKEAAVFQINEQSDMWQQLASAGLTPLANDLAALGDAAARGEEVTMEMVEATLARHGQDKAFLDNLFNAGGAAREWAVKLGDAQLTVEEAANQRARNEKRGGKEYQESVDDNVQTLTALQSATDRFMATIEHIRVQGFMALLGDTAQDGIQGAINGLNAMTDAMLKFSDSGKIESMAQTLKDNWQGIAGAAAVGIALFSKSLRSLAGRVMTAAGGMGKFAKGLGVLGVGLAGWQAGSMIYDKYGDTEGMIGFGDWLGGHVDFIRGKLGNEEAMQRWNRGTGGGDVLSPEAQRIADQARERRKNRAEKAKSAEAATTSATQPDNAIPDAGMSDADLAKLSVAERTAYTLSEILKVNKKMARALSADAFA